MRNARYLFLANSLLLCLWLIVRIHFLLDCSPATISQTESPASQIQLSQIKSNRRNVPKGGKSFNFTVAVCAIARDAEAYLTEWIDYNLLALEFDNIYIYDNSPNFDLQRWANRTRSHPIYSRVQVRHYPGRGWGFQTNAYMSCLQWEARFHDYVALIDIDEFIVLVQNPAEHSVIHDLVEEYLVPFGGAVTMNWVLFGTANKTIYSPVPVLKRFQYRDPEPEEVIKSFVKTKDVTDVRNPHAVTLRNNTLVRTTKYPGAIHTQQTSKTGSRDPERPSSVVLVHHYRFLSVKEYTFKRCVRKELVFKTKGCDEKTGTLNNDAPETAIHRTGTVRDTRAWDFLTSKVPKYRVFDNPEFEDYL